MNPPISLPRTPPNKREGHNETLQMKTSGRNNEICTNNTPSQGTGRYRTTRQGTSENIRPGPQDRERRTHNQFRIFRIIIYMFRIFLSHACACKLIPLPTIRKPFLSNQRTKSYARDTPLDDGTNYYEYPLLRIYMSDVFMIANTDFIWFYRPKGVSIYVSCVFTGPGSAPSAAAFRLARTQSGKIDPRPAPTAGDHTRRPIRPLSRPLSTATTPWRRGTPPSSLPCLFSLFACNVTASYVILSSNKPP